MSMTLTVEIPALDRLCAILEQQDRGALLAELKAEIVRQLEAAAKGEKKTTPPVPEGEGKGDAAMGTSSVAAEAAPPSPKGKAQEAAPTVEGKETPAKPEATGGEVKDADVRKALNGLIKAGKRDAVKAILKSFGADNFSKLKPADYAAVLEKTKEAGADD